MAQVLVIGASRGIGRELAQQYIDNGDRVIATVRRAEDRDALLAQGAAAVHLIDVAQPQSVSGLAWLLDVDAGFGKIGAEDVGAAPRHAGDHPVVDGAAVVRQAERHVRARQRNAAHDFGAVAVFGLLGFQKFAPRRRHE